MSHTVEISNWKCLRDSRVTRTYSNRTATVIKSNYDRNRNYIGRVLKTYGNHTRTYMYGNHTRTLNVRRSFAYVLEPYSNRTRIKL